MTKYLILYNHKDIQCDNIISADLIDWYEDIPLNEYFECFENKDKLLVKSYIVSKNFVLEQLGDNGENGNILISCKAFWCGEDPEKQLLETAALKFDTKHNEQYYDNLIYKINKDQILFDKAFKLK